MCWLHRCCQFAFSLLQMSLNGARAPWAMAILCWLLNCLVKIFKLGMQQPVTCRCWATRPYLQHGPYSFGPLWANLLFIEDLEVMSAESHNTAVLLFHPFLICIFPLVFGLRFFCSFNLICLSACSYESLLFFCYLASYCFAFSPFFVILPQSCKYFNTSTTLNERVHAVMSR